MEKFRELEKDYKQRKLTKVVFLNQSELDNKYIFSDSDSEERKNYNSEDNSEDSDPTSQAEEGAIIEETLPAHYQYQTTTSDDQEQAHYQTDKEH